MAALKQAQAPALGKRLETQRAPRHICRESLIVAVAVSAAVRDPKEEPHERDDPSGLRFYGAPEGI